MAHLSSLVSRAAPIVVDTLLIGGGTAATRVVHELAERGFAGKLFVVAKGEHWQDALPRDFRLGQSRQALTMFPMVEFHDPKGKMTNEELRRENISIAIQAAEKLPDVDGEETTVVRVMRTAQQRYTTHCENGIQIVSRQVIVSTGEGVERTLRDSGVTYEKEPPDKRRGLNEVITARQAMKMDPEFWRGKKVAFYGGGATAAFCLERLMGLGIPVGDIVWLGEHFKDANPAGRNDAVMEWMKERRVEGKMTALKFNGDETPPEGERGLECQVDVKSDPSGLMKGPVKVDVVVCATGQNPFSDVAAQAILGQLAQELKPCTGPNGGAFAQNGDGLFVTVTSMAHEQGYREIITKEMYTRLDPENHVRVGAQVARLSAQDAAAAAVAEFKQ
jgi:Pyridine nucleotide-disulphide oxidoreductase